MKNYTHAMVIAVFFTVISYNTIAQDETRDKYQVVTIEGNEFIGLIIEENETEIVLRTDEYGDMRIPRSRIKKITSISGATLVEGVYWPDNPQSTRYFWAPNGYGLARGEAYYQNIWVFYNQFSAGITDNISISAGLVPLFFLGQDAPIPVWVVPKVSFPVRKDKINIGAGAFLGGLLMSDGSEAFGIVFGNTTFGSRDRNVNIGLGWGFAGNSWADMPVVNVSFMARTGPKSYFISENYYLNFGNSGAVLFSLGGRSIIQRIGLDYALAMVISGRVTLLPFLGLTVPLSDGKKK